MKQLKCAWIRDDTTPIGFPAKGRFSCPCGNAPSVDLVEDGPDIICNCGRRYSWEGCIKGRSIGSNTLTAYNVIFSDGTSYSTSMSADTNLQNAYYYFMDRVIDGKQVVDVLPNIMPYWERETGWDKSGNCLTCGEAGRCHCYHPLVDLEGI